MPWYWGGLHEQIVSFFCIMFFVRSLRDSWKRIITVIFDSLGIGTMIISYIGFFTLLGYVLFNNDYYVDGYGYFVSIPDTMFNVYVLFTTSNFPDIIFPYWKIHNWTVLYFVIFLVVGLYLLLNLMLAVFYNSFKHQIDSKISKYDKMREQYLTEEFQKVLAHPMEVKEVERRNFQPKLASCTIK